MFTLAALVLIDPYITGPAHAYGLDSSSSVNADLLSALPRLQCPTEPLFDLALAGSPWCSACWYLAGSSDFAFGLHWGLPLFPLDDVAFSYDSVLSCS
ncbi:hypothetical protein B0H14DRAFT_3471643 [Mycena olivaceomarginata]|nr:hypothetical protein B0H14DRAFT_3471643 [Mycena olivaceomarginata]